jgi:hypothetical protein
MPEKALREAVTRPCNHRKRFPEWRDPPKACDCCGGPAVLVQNRVLYGSNQGKWPVVWYCLSCEASTGCHPFSVFPMGIMADRQTKAARRQMHELLDPIWESGLMSRSEAYALLAERMGVPPWEEVHVAWMSLQQCAVAAECIRELSLAVQFGA